MQWFISAAGLLILFLLAWGTRRAPAPSYRDAPLADELAAHLRREAAQLAARGKARIPMPRGFLRVLQAAVPFLDGVKEADRLPAARWLCDNGRFLQEEAAGLGVALASSPKLPRAGDTARVMVFARELLGHTGADVNTSRLPAAVRAWQEGSPFTTDELNALPLALRAALLQLILELTRLCVLEQRAQLAADQLPELLKKGRERAALRLFRRFEHMPAFLERLTANLRDAEPNALWLRHYFDHSALSADRVAQGEHRHQTDHCVWMSSAITSLRTIARAPWHRLLEEMSTTHAALLEDATYPRMDMESRAYYRAQVARFAKRTRKPEISVCAAALTLAQSGEGVRAEVGYYLLSDGRAALRGYLQGFTLGARVSAFLEQHATQLLRLCSWTIFAALCVFAYVTRLFPALWLPFAAVFVYAAQQGIVWLYTRHLPARMVPRMAVDALTDENATLVVCPTMLLSPEHALTMVKHLSVLHQANPDPRLHFMLLGDFQDSLTGTLSGDDGIVRTAAAAVHALLEDTGHPFYYLQRERVFHPPDHVHMSRERKRGSLETLLKLIAGRAIVERFAYTSLPLEDLKGRYRYVITLDSDTFLPPGAALRMVGAMLHPLQRGRVSILQPRMEVAAHTVGSPLSLLLGARGGTDPYNALMADFYQDASGRGSFVGKGMLDPEPFLNATEGKVIAGAVLSHDLLEGELAGCATASDITLYDGHPAHLRGFLMRLHRWTRGDWQLLPYVLPLFPADQAAPKAALSTLGKHKIWQNLLRSLVQPFRLILLVYACLSNRPWLMLCTLVLPELSTLLRPPLDGVLAFLCRIAVLPVEACMQADAIARTLYRLFVSRRNLLRWTTAAQLSCGDGKPPMQFFYMSMACAGVMAAISLLWPNAQQALGLMVAAWWASLPALLPMLEQPYHRKQRPTGYMREVLLGVAKSTLLFFEITEEDNALPPDNVQIEPNKGVSHRTSPTNIGLYLTSLIAAEKLLLLTPEEMARRMQATVRTLESLPKWEGHLYNWYDTRTLAPLAPLFVSTVDSGNLAACLLTCAQGVRALLPQLPTAYHQLPARLDHLATAMRFQPLYDADAELFFIGVHPAEPNEVRNHYDLLASEARLASFVAIMLGQVPVKHWYRLGRPQARTRRGQALLSYSGTMFEYLMPALLQPPVRGTLLMRAYRAAYGVQQSVRPAGVFGVSESGYYAFDPNLYYQYRAFGIPALALDPIKRRPVIAPYATFLALTVDMKGAFANILRLKALGMEGPMGFFEAADFGAGEGKRGFQLVRSHMAHHQGMILCAICNALCEDYVAHLFSDLPKAQAHRLLLEEKPVRARGLIRHPLKRSAAEPSDAPHHFERDAEPLRFPVDAHVLYGGGTTLLVDAQGGGFLSRHGVQLSRFHESCRLPSGIRLYLRDAQKSTYRCLTDPHLCQSVRFETAQAVFTSERHELSATLRAFVNPLDGAALHVLTLENKSGADRMLEVCSYLEPALAPQREDAAHPAFQNLFVETERLGRFGVAATRRPRRAEDSPRRMWHQLCSDQSLTVFRVQTDRAAFIGRGRSVYAPRALEMPAGALSDSVGAMIEPCLSLRGQFLLAKDGKAQFVFSTLLAAEQDSAAAFQERYALPESAQKAFEAARTQGLMTARYLQLTQDEQAAISRLAGAVAYTGQPHQALHAAQNTLPLRDLWGLALSGDLPIVLLRCSDARELSLARLMLKAHAYYRTAGLWMDLVLLADQPSSYAHPLRDALEELVGAGHGSELVGKDGGIHLLDREHVSAELVALLHAAARLVLSTDGGTLFEQLTGHSLRGKPLYTVKPPAHWATALPPAPERLLENGYGGFTADTGDYQLELPAGRQTPAPWCLPLCNERFGTLASESGLVFSYAGNSHLGRLTRWPNDSISPVFDERLFLRDEAHKLLWSPMRAPLGNALQVRVTHAPGETLYEAAGYGLYTRVQCFTDIDADMGVRVLTLKNECDEERVLTLFHACTFALGMPASGWPLTYLHRHAGVVYAESPQLEGISCLAGIDPEPTLTTTMAEGAFDGLWGVAPHALAVADSLPGDAGNTALTCFTVQLRAGESRTLSVVLGNAATRERLDRQLAALRADGTSLRLHRVRQHWEERFSGLSFDVPDVALRLMLNRWLPYQVRAARLWMRAGFYQAGGAIGFRDQLQDQLSILHTEPQRVREHLLTCAAHQFEEGDVQHWWHPPRYGVRTRISDDLLWLPFVTAAYVAATGDSAVLHEQVAYLHEEPLAQGEEERLGTPEISAITEPLREHCLRAIERVAYGAHGLPLMGGGDWNDGMNEVGGENGESVWLGMFLCEVIRRFAPLCTPVEARRLMERRAKVLHALERHAWDGAWYLRAWFEDGTPLGASRNAECRIDLLSQSWAVLCGLSRERAAVAMDHAWRMLYERDIGILKLFTPPFEGEMGDGVSRASRAVEAAGGAQGAQPSLAQPWPGYIAGYIGGVRENGGQYTHAVPWAIAAFHQLGEHERAWELLSAMLPPHHAATRQLAARYRVEPYVLAADIYAAPNQRGRGGWTWYTGSASWLQVVVLEQLLGFQKTGNRLRFRPVAPDTWDRLRITYRYGSATYHLHATRDCPYPTADGDPLKDGTLILTDDAKIHEATFPLRNSTVS